MPFHYHPKCILEGKLISSYFQFLEGQPPEWSEISSFGFISHQPMLFCYRHIPVASPASDFFSATQNDLLNGQNAPPSSLQRPPSLSKSSSRRPLTENKALTSYQGLQEFQELPSSHLCGFLSPQAMASKSVCLQKPHRYTFSSLQKAQLKSSCSLIC